MLEILVSLPALNEEKTLGQLIDKIKSLKIDNAKIEVLVIDDGSTDRTVAIAQEKGVEIISHNTNKGVGAAIQTAINHAIFQKNNILVNIDSDGQFDPSHIPKLVDPILKKDAEFVTASRFIDGSKINMPKVKRWGNKRVAKLVSRLSKQRIHDVSCGFRAYSRKSLLNLSLIGDFTYTHESILILAFKGIAIKEVAVPVKGTREFGESRVASNILKYAFNSLMIIFRCLRDYRPMYTFGLPGVLLTSIGIVLFLLFFGWSLLKGEWFPKIAAFAGAFSLLSGILFLLIAVITDMFTRLRVKIEKLVELIDKK
jgi:glycosyltransferase involved in cell wall biosynthesis